MSKNHCVTVDQDAKMRAEQFVVPKAENPERIVVALSGGVDSSVAAWLLTEAGHTVIGVTLRLAPDDTSSLEVRQGRCCSSDDMTDARQLCDALGIPFYAVDARDRFKEAVFDPFVEAYRKGLTPIPCLACNHEVKFGDLYATARSLDAKLATGHYARVCDVGGYKTIGRPFDMSRDQTYYLYGTASEVADHLVLPLGDLDKPLVRALAQKAGLPVFAKPDSQEICFVPDGDHAKIVEKARGPMPEGELVHISGKKLRKHDGIHKFTVGQRRGISMGTGDKLYVVDVDPDTNKVTMGPREALQVTSILVEKLRPIIPVSAWPDEIFVQVRARQVPAKATWRLVEDDLAPESTKNNLTKKLELHFVEPVQAVALGHAAVCYAGDAVLGGGVISARLDGAIPRRAQV